MTILHLGDSFSEMINTINGTLLVRSYSRPFTANDALHDNGICRMSVLEMKHVDKHLGPPTS